VYADRLQYFVAPKLGPDEWHVHQYVIGPISGGVCSVSQLTQARVGLWQQAVNEVALGLPQGLDDCVLEQHNTNIGTQCHTNNPSSQSSLYLTTKTVSNVILTPIFFSSNHDLFNK